MSLELDLPPELETRLRSEAERRGEPVNAVAVRLLDQHLPATREKAVELLQRWAAEAEQLSEQEAAENADVLRALDADRPSDRPLFTDLTRKPA